MVVAGLGFFPLCSEAFSHVRVILNAETVVAAAWVSEAEVIEQQVELLVERLAFERR
jgi:hypothetical protein